MRNLKNNGVTIKMAGGFMRAMSVVDPVSDECNVLVEIKTGRYTAKAKVSADRFKRFANALAVTYEDMHTITCKDLSVVMQEHYTLLNSNTGDDIKLAQKFKAKVDVIMTPGMVSYFQVVTTDEAAINKIRRYSDAKSKMVQVESFAIDDNAALRIKEFAKTL